MSVSGRPGRQTGLPTTIDRTSLPSTIDAANVYEQDNSIICSRGNTVHNTMQ